MSKLKHEHFDCAVGCSVEATLELIGGKWKGVILYHLLQESVLRFSQLQKLFPNCTQRTLTNQLRALEADGFVLRVVYAQVPPKVEYSLTERGLTLAPVILALKAWGDMELGKTTATEHASGL
ncbi:helix-turn-helix transcriptional regulator [Vitreoscilla massiliensis]|uniref:Helix-turn-helix transcriptional regulator n=1 Tax=Vitreoscilla massiliensis TaxID=1689272 RepID=A0ABY4E4H9_9NEIS|nr:helix-turn-helix domain-containing protein [Vitreoscilla massiliensis]UOO90653.1 helix-turn-helix transcriptional regulator [Vitreoscilla massiliensis]